MMKCIDLSLDAFQLLSILAVGHFALMHSNDKGLGQRRLARFLMLLRPDQ